MSDKKEKTLKDRVKESLVLIGLLALTCFIGGYTIYYIVDKIEHEPIQAECTNLSEQDNQTFDECVKKLEIIDDGSDKWLDKKSYCAGKTGKTMINEEEVERQRKQKEQEKKEQREKDREEARLQFEESKRKWLENNPPVDLLFDSNRRADTEYVIEYLKRNPIAGDCALSWIHDVVCSTLNTGIKFPTERK